MDETFKLADRSGTNCRGPLPFFLSLICASTLIAIFLGSLLSGCGGSGAPVLSATSVQPAVSKYATTAENVGGAVKLAVEVLPAKVKTDLANLIAAHPEAGPFLNTVANGIESFAKEGAALPTPASLQNGVLPWVEDIPQLGGYVAEAFTIYQLAYPTLAPTASTLTAFAEFIRAEATPVPAAQAVAATAARHADDAALLGFCFYDYLRGARRAGLLRPS